MKPGLKTAISILVPALLIAGSAAVSRHIWRENGLRTHQAVDEQRVQLIANAVRSEVNRQDHLPIVLALDPDVQHALKTRDSAEFDRLTSKLQRICQEADTRALYVIDKDGLVIAAGQRDTSDPMVGRNMSERPYLKMAIAAGHASYLGVEPQSNQVRYYIAERLRDSAYLGTAVVRIEFEEIESAWKKAGERVLITDSKGIVFLASEPGYKFRTVGAIDDRRVEPEDSMRYSEPNSNPITFDVLERRGSVDIVRTWALGKVESYLHQSLLLPEYGWTIHRLMDLSSIEEDQRDGAIIGGTLAAFLVFLLLYLVQRQRAYMAARDAGARLQGQIEERTHELQIVNRTLQAEIDERRRTEARLRATQNELVQAGKLAALGQMSAAIAHEINQPLAAIRTFMASTLIYLQRGDSDKVAHNIRLINDLAERMAKITAHLKTFARRNDPGKPERVPIERAVDGALFLLESQTKNSRVRIVKDVQPDVYTSGYSVQLEQVILNLVHNALDAVAAVDDPEIRIRVTTGDDHAIISVMDNGRGIPSEDLDRIFDPFFTTKPVGKGLGLGLSIAYGIVQDFDGRMRASNRESGGAELVIELPLYDARKTQPEAAQHA
jgi:two-component system, NtrC family, C4-dicarboxylate transport sensor histidine kinase DctB